MSKRATQKIIDPNQNTISCMFIKKPVAKQNAQDVVVKPDTEFTTSNVLTSTDPIVQQYYNSLCEKEQRAHSIAIEKLGTSYDIVRTHGFLNWQKARK